MKFHPWQSIAKRLNRLRRFPVLARRRGAVLLLDPRNWVDSRVLAAAPFENAQLTRAQALIESLRLDVVVDIGANFGLYTVLLGGLPSITKVVAFEPVRRNHAQLLGNVFANDLTGKVEAHRAALGSAAAHTEIHIVPRSTGMSRLSLEGCGRVADKFIQRETVAVVRFDDVCTLKGRRVFVKMDVEGMAHDVLAGMSTFLSSNAVALQVELAEHEFERAEAILLARGYKAAGRIEGDFYFLGPSL